jgi:hypothetical protein
MVRRFGALLLSGFGGWMLVAGCTAAGSTAAVNGPAYDLDAGDGTDAAIGIAAGDGGATDAGETGDADGAPSGSGDARSDAAGTDAATSQPPVDAAPIGPDGGDDGDGGTDGAPSGDDAGCTATTALFGGNDFSLFAATAIGTAPFTAAFGGGFQALFTEAGEVGGGNALFAIGFGAGAWSTPIALGGSADAIGAPAIAPVGTTLQGVYLNPANLYFHATFTNTNMWDTGADPVRPPNDGGGQAFGPVSAAAAGTATELVIAYEGDDLLPYAQTWTTGVGWDDGVALGTAALLADTPMAIVALDGGASDLLAVYIDGEGSASMSNEHLFFALRSASTSTWSLPAMVNADAFTPAAPTLTALSGGGALVAWQGGNGEGYESVYDGTNGSWSSPAQLTAAQVASAPSLAQGVCGDDAIAAYVSGGLVYTTHFAGGAWSVPSAFPAGSGSTAVSIATAP